MGGEGRGRGREGRGVTLEAQVKVNGWAVWRKVALFTHVHDQVHVPMYPVYTWIVQTPTQHKISMLSSGISIFNLSTQLTPMNM